MLKKTVDSQFFHVTKSIDLSSLSASKRNEKDHIFQRTAFLGRTPRKSFKESKPLKLANQRNQIYTPCGLISHKRPTPASDHLGLTFRVVAYWRFKYE